MEIFVNGKQIDIEKCSFKDIVESIIGKQIEDLPAPYETVEDYLGLTDFDLTKTVTDEQLEKFAKMMLKRLEFAKAHKKDVDFKAVNDVLNIEFSELQGTVNEMTNMIKACNLIRSYINDIKNLSK